MPRGRDDDDNNSADGSLSAPPDAPSTEQYQPVHSRHSGRRAQGGSGGRGAADNLDAYHARFISFNSETDVHDEDDDTLTMPVPDSVRAAKVPSVPPPIHPLEQQQQQQQRRPSPLPSSAQEQRTLIPLHPSPSAGPLPLRRTPSPSKQPVPSRKTPTTATVQQQQQHYFAPSSSPAVTRVSPPPRSPPPAMASSPRAPPPHPVEAPPSASAAPRANIADSSGFHFTTRQANPPAVSLMKDPAHTSPPSPAPHVAAAHPLLPSPNFMLSPPCPTPAILLREQQRQQRRRSPQRTAGAGQQQQQHEALLLPPPYDRPLSPPTAAAAPSASHLLAPHPNPSNSASAAQWQLSSPPDRARAEHDTAARGAVFDYASEAVNTLEQQYGDALQRLNTMHRLYDRLDGQNRVLEEEVIRLRRVNDVLNKGVAFNVYNSVRQVKHEMKLLRQYVAVLCTGFNNSMQALQQVVAEDVPRLLGKDAGYTALLPYGVQGRLRSMETRVSVGRGSSQQDAFAMSPPQLSRDSMMGGPSTSGSGVSAAAEHQLYQPDYWWNAMSPQPLRPPSTQAAEADQPPQQQTSASEMNRVGGGSDSDGTEGLTGDHQALFEVKESGQQGAVSQDVVSFEAYRRVQAALAEARRRVVELEQRSAHHQSDYEARVAQLKVAHRAREARLADELALLKRVEPITTESDASLPQTTTAAMSVDVNALAQLLAIFQKQQQQQQQQQQQTTTSATVASASLPSNTHRPCAERTIAFSSNSADVEGRGREDEDEGEGREDNADDGMVDSRDPHSSSGGSTHGNNSEDGNFDCYYGNRDPRESYERTSRRIVRATAVDRDRPSTVSGDDGRLHRPDRYSATAAARWSERARQVLGDDDAPITSTERRPRSFAYDRLMDHRDVPVGPSTSSARRAGKASPQNASVRGRSQKREKEGAPCRRGDGGTSKSRSCGRRGVDLHNVDPALLQSVLDQLALSGNNGGRTYASTSAARSNAKVDRLAQGLWAQEMLKERNYI